DKNEPHSHARLLPREERVVQCRDHEREMKGFTPKAVRPRGRSWVGCNGCRCESRDESWYNAGVLTIGLAVSCSQIPFFDADEAHHESRDAQHDDERAKWRANQSDAKCDEQVAEIERVANIAVWSRKQETAGGGVCIPHDAGAQVGRSPHPQRMSGERKEHR